ncbi:hypothetical protein CTJ08_13085 [Staphylococcus epidermidis]|uniref:SGNH hydrolase-type esterase domain-containing protein n=1 Tax=Staphylococcus epidermidis TaxID=1282 RepID=A0AAE5QW89_STAEP|nr:SGNH/GDSL hydrolase family protein [Staphylococcus epidermidis]MBE9409809.1 SGNH/GDSL hydrolase family protein [Staphylococcus epidermidis]MBG3866706.1 SGNH/GDSL hydrolase family protein [Staphylococcus epidermidis]PIH08420.1 hypothetical protein CTJ00_00510 [Staphylococcus epidermidis]PIH09058.1 hypothetical protein CTJ08_13085 [Staphylococcus epidermidis]
MSEINHRYLVDRKGDTYFPITHTDAIIGLDEYNTEFNTSSYLSGKNIVSFGDDFTELGNYPQFISSTTGANVIDIGISNSRMGMHAPGEIGQLMDKQSMYKLVDYIKTNDYSELIKTTEELAKLNGDDNQRQATNLKNVKWNQIDYITIFLGTNDYGGDNLIGSNNDFDGSTFKGAINKTIKTLSETIPNARLVFITPIFRNRYKNRNGANSDNTKNDAGFYLQNYSDAIKELATLNHIPVIDLMSISGINKYNYKFYLSDNFNLNQKGNDLLSNIIQKQLEII